MNGSSCDSENEAWLNAMRMQTRENAEQIEGDGTMC